MDRRSQPASGAWYWILLVLRQIVQIIEHAQLQGSTFVERILSAENIRRCHLVILHIQQITWKSLMSPVGCQYCAYEFPRSHPSSPLPDTVWYMTANKILLIGDEPNFLRSMRRNLVGRGYDVSVADDQEAYLIPLLQPRSIRPEPDFTTIDIDGLASAQSCGAEPCRSLFCRDRLEKTKIDASIWSG
jgi:hypothetical protein